MCNICWTWELFRTGETFHPSIPTYGSFITAESSFLSASIFSPIHEFDIVKNKTPPHISKNLWVKKLGEFKKTKSNRNLLGSPNFGPKKSAKKGLLFPVPPKAAVSKSVWSPSENGDDGNSDRSYSSASPTHKPQSESPKKGLEKANTGKLSIDIVKLDTNSDTESDPSPDFGKGIDIGIILYSCWFQEEVPWHEQTQVQNPSNWG